MFDLFLTNHFMTLMQALDNVTYPAMVIVFVVMTSLVKPFPYWASQSSKHSQEIQIFKALPKPDQTHQQFFEHHKFDAGGLISQL